MRDAFDNKKSESFRTERTKVLFIRNVLDSPVIVKPGELYTFTLTLN
jgi:hypothetical protein